MADKITNTYHSAMGATKETIGKIVHNEHLMNSGKRHVFVSIILLFLCDAKNDLTIFVPRSS